MLPQSQRASDIARFVVDDGDDLCISTSFLPSEENSSIAGNISMTASVTKKKSVPSELIDPNSNGKGGATCSSPGNSDDGSYNSDETGEELRRRTKPLSAIEKVLGTTAVKKGLNSAQKLLVTPSVKSFLLTVNRSHRRTSSRSSTDYREMEESEEMTGSHVAANSLHNDQTGKGPNNVQKLLPTAGVKSFLLKRSHRQSSSWGSTDYKEMEDSAEMIEAPAGEDTFPDDQSHRSIRSTRIDAATGRSMLVRQNAQVMGRPSAAQQEWDVGSVVSSSESSSSGSFSSKRFGRNLVWDSGSRSVRSDISHLTGDSFRSKRSDFSLSKAMYVSQTGQNLLGDTNEDDDITNFSGDEDVQNTTFFESLQKERILRFSQPMQSTNREVTSIASSRNPKAIVDDFVLSTDDDFSQISELNIRGANSDDGLFSPRTGILPVRERVLSDSEFLFEMLRRKRRISAEQGCDGSHDQDDLECTRRSPTPIGRSASYSDFLFPPPMDELDEAQRPRCFSESNVAYIDAEDGDGMKFLENLDFDISRLQRNVVSAPTEIHRMLKEGASKLPALVLPSFVRGIQPRGGGKGTDSIPLLSDHDDDDSVMQQPGRLSDSGFDVSTPPRNGGFEQAIQRPRNKPASGGVPVNDSLIRQASEPMRIPLQGISRVSAATATNAAKMFASALRPPVGASLPSRTTKAYDYYWSTNDEASTGNASHEVLWNLSDNDSFDDMF